MQKLNNKTMSEGSGYLREYNVNYVPRKGGTYIIEIDDAISHVSQFSTAIQVLNIAEEEDEIDLRLMCCPGGLVDGGDSFLHALRNTKAHVHATATGGTHSMATQILLECDSFELSHGFNSLIHAGQDGAGGTVSEYRAKSKFDMEFRDKQFRDCYEGFLTPKEIEAALDGKDIWLDATGWCERAIKRLEYFQKKIEDAKKVEKPKRVKKPAKDVVNLNLAPLGLQSIAGDSSVLK